MREKKGIMEEKESFGETWKDTAKRKSGEGGEGENENMREKELFWERWRKTVEKESGEKGKEGKVTDKRKELKKERKARRQKGGEDDKEW